THTAVICIFSWVNWRCCSLSANRQYQCNDYLWEQIISRKSSLVTHISICFRYNSCFFNYWFSNLVTWKGNTQYFNTNVPNSKKSNSAITYNDWFIYDRFIWLEKNRKNV